MSVNNTRESNFRSLLVLAGLGLLILLFLNWLIGGMTGYGSGMYYGRGMGNTTGLTGSVIGLIMKLLWFVFYVSLLAGLTVAAKKYVFDDKKLDLSIIRKLTDMGSACPVCGARINSSFRFCPGCKADLKETCAQCSGEMKLDWEFCPSCGKSNKGTGEVTG